MVIIDIIFRDRDPNNIQIVMFLTPMQVLMRIGDSEDSSFVAQTGRSMIFSPIPSQ
jgi:hypothetical protein